MEIYLNAVVVFLALNMGIGVARAARGNEPASLLLAALLFGSTGVAILLLLATSLGQPALRDVALAFVALSALTVVVFVHRGEDIHEPDISEGTIEGTPDARS